MRYKWCPQCETFKAVTEQDAFGGMDKSRSVLNCGHVILKETPPQDFCNTCGQLIQLLGKTWSHYSPDPRLKDHEPTRYLQGIDKVVNAND